MRRESEKKKGRGRERGRVEGTKATAQKLIVHEVTFEEESEAQVEGNRWRRANHVKWKCTSDGHEGWTEGVGKSERTRMAKRGGAEEG